MNTTWGILAHVDAGKTTLTEAILYNAGVLADLGRVDKGSAFLDTDLLEKKRGITIFSKQAMLECGDDTITLLDTPGHIDFSTETERAIWALDFAILLINATDGVQAHTKTLFSLLKNNAIPTVIVINKIDMPDIDMERLMLDIKTQLSSSCYLLTDQEDIAVEDELAMEEFIEKGSLSYNRIYDMIINRKFIPVLAGSALKNEGISDILTFMRDLSKYSIEQKASLINEEFAARVYKIESLGQDTRLTFAKLTSGRVKVKSSILDGEKIDQIRLYSGTKYRQIEEAVAGDIVAFTGLKASFAGQGIGLEKDRPELATQPVLKYKFETLDASDPRLVFTKLAAFNDEDSSLNVSWNERLEEITFNLMGQVQAEIILTRIQNELGIKGQFVVAGVLYKETIKATVEGVGHFEPLKHYAEVHVLMEPLALGTGIQVDSSVSTDALALNWQRLIETHILEKDHIGVSIGAPITDVKFTIIAGKAHIKHTEGGDFREATYRAIRQGLMEVGTDILEPYYDFEIIIPSEHIGRVMTDIENMSGKFDIHTENDGRTSITGSAPAVNIINYHSSLIAYTKGMGSINLFNAHYDKCFNPEEIMKDAAYDPDNDIDNPSASVFCSHGSAELVPWFDVKNCCHVPCLITDASRDEIDYDKANAKRMNHGVDEWLDPDEIDSILRQATHNNHGKNPKKGWHYGQESRPRRVDSDYVYSAPKEIKAKEKYLLVDGYNLIYAWPELKEVLEVNLDGARGKLLDILSNYKAMTDYNVIAVFDAYKVKGHEVTSTDYLNIHQVFTAEAQTADAYIERFTHEHGKKYDITVVTSDGLEQVIIRGAGAKLISSREFIDEVERMASMLRERFDISYSK